MARVKELMEIAKQHDLVILTIEELIEYRERTEQR